MKWQGAEVIEREEFITPLSMVTASQYLKKIGFIDMINKNVKWDVAQCNLSPGMLAQSVVLSTFSSRRSPLYHIAQSFAGMDLEGLFGLNCLESEFTDDAIGRTLDKIYEVGPSRLYGQFSLSTLAKFDMTVRSMHADTSSLSLYGAYKSEQENNDNKEDSPISICHGHSKDNHPELLQVMIGKIVTEHGIPIVSIPLDGNTSDSRFNQDMMAVVAETFGDKMKDMVYIADSKLISKPTLKVLNSQSVPIQFISRCPDSFATKCAVKLKTRAFLDNNWVDQGVLGKNKQCAQYQTQSYDQIIDGHTYRLIVVHTSAGRNRVEKALQKSESQFEKFIKKQDKKRFSCEADAKKAKADGMKEFKNSYHEITWTVETIKEERRPRGNPGKLPKLPTTEITWFLKGKITGLATGKVEELRRKDESFVLITNVKKEQKDDREVLLEYKGQHVVENQFHLLKQPSMAAQIFIKNAKRIEALLMLLTVSLLVRALMQWQVRKQLEGYKEKPKVGPNKTRLTSPTAEAILKMLLLHNIHRQGDEAWSPCRDPEHLYRFNTWIDLLQIQLGD